VAACGGGGATYGAAAAGLGATVLASGIHRAVTGSCWANCAKGFYCDHESGLCQRGECDPSCGEGDYCVKESNGFFRCVAPAGTYAFGKAKPSPAESASSADAGSPAPLVPYVSDGGASPDIEGDDAGLPADAGPDAASHDAAGATSLAP
jgi:hypothetical protein